MGTSSCWSCPIHRLPVRVRSWWRSRRPESERGIGCSTAPAGTWGCAPRRRWAWRVRAVGAGVDEFAVGDRVLAHEAPLPGASGFWAERVLLTAAHAAPCPSGLQPLQADAFLFEHPSSSPFPRGGRYRGL